MTLDQLIEFLRIHRDVLQQHGVTGLYVFGSFARGEARGDSDVDMFVDFEPGRKVGLFELLAIKHELSDLLGRSVDLTTRGGLRTEIRETALREAVRAA